MHQGRIDWEWAVLCSWYVWLLLMEWVRKLGSMMFLFKSTMQIQCNCQSVISALRRFRITGAACFNHLQSMTKQNMRLMVADQAPILVPTPTFWRPVAARSSFRFHRLLLHPKHQFWSTLRWNQIYGAEHFWTADIGHLHHVWGGISTRSNIDISNQRSGNRKGTCPKTNGINSIGLVMVI